MMGTPGPLTFSIMNYLLFRPETMKALYLMSFMTKKSYIQRDAAQSFKDIKDICWSSQPLLFRFHDLALANWLVVESEKYSLPSKQNLDININVMQEYSTRTL